MTADELIQQVVSKHRDAYEQRAPAWKGFAISCWFGDGQRETVKYYYDLPEEAGKQVKTPSVYSEFRELKRLLPDPDDVHAVILTYVRGSGAADLRIIRDPDEAAQYQNWVGNPFDIAAAIRPVGV